VTWFACYPAHNLHSIAEPLKLSAQLPAFLAHCASTLPEIVLAGQVDSVLVG
jgi:hypothetical protein